MQTKVKCRCQHAYDISVINMRLDRYEAGLSRLLPKQENFSFLLIIIYVRTFVNCNTTACGQSKMMSRKYDYIKSEGNQNV